MSPGYTLVVTKMVTVGYIVTNAHPLMARDYLVDWAAMEADWRAGIKSVLQLSDEHKVSRAGIIKHWANECV